jgi:hypothetical protein
VSYRVWLIYGMLVLLLSACSFPTVRTKTKRIELAEFTESYVHVVIELERTGEGRALLETTFTPTEEDAHLYSMDLPEQGIEGIGRPTRVELPEGAFLQAAGDLQESAEASYNTVADGVPAMLVYPEGAVTLTLPVLLPDEDDLPVNDQVLVTYMACTSTTCHAPVVDKAVDIHLTGK